MMNAYEPPIMSIHHVAQDGTIDLVSANVPYSNLQWTRRMSVCGEFQAELACDMPVVWPGRYIVTLDGRGEVGVIEKADVDESGKTPPTILGRFMECLMDRYRFPHPGASVSGANWRQAVTQGIAAWRMPDCPRIVMGEGTQAKTGSSYVIAGDAGASGMESVLACASSNGSTVLLTYDRASMSGCEARIVTGLDRTRSQSKNPICVFSIDLMTALSVKYSGDYSVECSEVSAYAEKDEVITSAAAIVPGFDGSAMWMQRAVEDVGSLFGEDEPVTAEKVSSYGGLRAYDHMADLEVSCDVDPAGYRRFWDLCDLVEVEMPSVGSTCTARIEEVSEVLKPEGMEVTAVIGNRQISRARRAMMGRR